MSTHPLRLAAAALLASLTAGCGAADRLANVGKQPALSAIENPTTQPGYKPVQMPMPEVVPVSYQPNSLWRSGARGFFKDPRAKQVGDLLTVKVEITDKAEIENTTKRSRTNAEGMNLDHVLGYEGYLKKVLPGGVDPKNAVDLGSSSASEGSGSTRRPRTQ